MSIQLGDRVRDKVSGFVGIASARLEFLNGCIRIDVIPPVDKEGKRVDGATFDLDQLEVVDAQVVPYKYAQQQLPKPADDFKRTGGNQMPSRHQG